MDYIRSWILLDGHRTWWICRIWVLQWCFPLTTWGLWYKNIGQPGKGFFCHRIHWVWWVFWWGIIIVLAIKWYLILHDEELSSVGSGFAHWSTVLFDCMFVFDCLNWGLMLGYSDDTIIFLCCFIIHVHDLFLVKVRVLV